MPVWTLGTHRSRGNGTYLWGRHSASRSMVKTSSPFLDSTTVHQPASRPLRCLTPPGLTGEREDEKVGRQVQISLTRLQSLARVFCFVRLTYLVIRSGIRRRPPATRRLVNKPDSTHRANWAHCFLADPGVCDLSLSAKSRLWEFFTSCKDDTQGEHQVRHPKISQRKSLNLRKEHPC
ncbi:uncharacterized protein LOC102899311 isoform X2 [Felis catus]|uniref:uncharacterized protein LOC102899311 isoform X2 n=1 Tax=Felis catus TaxID=9685 RepID=UPI001D19FAE1|nr:uncharacterized protein LOC102899311 isoform X2 [Felis catus]